ncbi:MAG: hypothetical protein EOM32_08520 [Spirochaetia bacterium]|nr:hypothetical protein [Spirochaetia bacterium]
MALGFVENDDFKAAYPIFKVFVDHKDVKQKTLGSYAKAFPTSTVTFDSGVWSHVTPLTGAIGSIDSEPAMPTRIGYVFSGWYKDLSFESKWDFRSDVVIQDMTLYTKWFGPVTVQGLGPAGGHDFYDKGSYSNGWRYLEAAPASNEWSGKVWGGYGTQVEGIGSAIGTGASNTEKIVAQFGTAEPYKKKTDYISHFPHPNMTIHR